MIPGDFLCGNVASILDKGSSVIEMLNAIGVNYVCFGSTEAHLPPHDLRKRISEFKGTWLNSNMTAWTPALPEYDIIEVKSPSGEIRKVGVIGLCSYAETLAFKNHESAFGGAWTSAANVPETVARLKRTLIEELGCDFVISLTNQPHEDDLALAQEDGVGLAVIIGGRDHEPLLTQVTSSTANGMYSTQIVKCGVGHKLAGTNSTKILQHSA